MRLHKNIFAQKGFYWLEYIAYPKKKRKNNKRTNKHKNGENGACMGSMSYAEKRH